MVRSRNGHGIIRAIETDAARKMPGVLAVYTAADLAGYGPLKCVVPLKNRDGSPMKKPWRGALAKGKVRYVGDPVACVIAETVLEAKDAAEAVEVDIDPLASVVTAEGAARDGAPLLCDDVPGNVALDYHYGDSATVEAAFANAAHVTRLKLINSRVVVNTMEPRAAVAAYDGSRFTFYVGSQGVTGMRGQVADTLGVDAKAVHMLTGQVGGSFGMKGVLFPEYVCVLHGARALGRPVKWTDERSGSFFSDSHGRDHEFVGEVALGEGRHVPRHALHRLRRYGRIPLADGTVPGNAQHRQEHAEHVSNAADRSFGQMRVHQHLADRPLSRRRPARGQLFHGAADG